MTGRGTGAFVTGTRVTSFSQISPGDLLVMTSLTSGAVNLIKVLRLDPTPLKRRLFDWAYADGDNQGRAFGGGAFDPERPQGAIWEWEFAGGQGSPAWLELHRAVTPADVGRVRTYRDLLDHFGAGDAYELRAAVHAHLGRHRTKIYLHGRGLTTFYLLPGPEQPPADFRMESFTVSVRTGPGEFDGDEMNQMFSLPLRERQLSMGMLELMDPDKALAEGEEFAFVLGQGSREEVARG